VSSSFAL
jgi:hypothetical protein